MEGRRIIASKPSMDGDKPDSLYVESDIEPV